MNNPVIIGVLAWLFPGAGHFLQGKHVRGLILSAAIWSMIIIAIFSGGAYFPGFGFDDGQLLYMLNLFAKAGNGLGTGLSYLFSMEPDSKAAALSTFEYGGKFIETAGLLNYLAIIDAIDIYLGRKK